MASFLDEKVSRICRLNASLGQSIKMWAYSSGEGKSDAGASSLQPLRNVASLLDEKVSRIYSTDAGVSSLQPLRNVASLLEEAQSNKSSECLIGTINN